MGSNSQQWQVHSSSCGSTRLHTWWQEMYLSLRGDLSSAQRVSPFATVWSETLAVVLDRDLTFWDHVKYFIQRDWPSEGYRLPRIFSDSSTGARRVSKHRHLYFQYPRTNILHTGTKFLNRTMESYGGCKIQSFA